GRELGRGHARAATSLDAVEHSRVEPVPPAGAQRIEPVGMPEDGERAAVRGRPVEQCVQPRRGTLRGQAEIALFGQRRVHRGERDLEDVRRTVALEVPRVEWTGDPGAEAERVRKSERRRLAERRPEPRAEHVALEARRRAAHADARPSPRVVDVVRERDPERGIAETELLAQALERWIERIEPRPFGTEAPVLVARAV